jgi:hypothetical protein
MTALDILRRGLVEMMDFGIFEGLFSTLKFGGQ